MVRPQKWYVVVVGKDPGVYSSWIEAGPKTKNIPGGSIHQSFSSEDAAIRMFEAAMARGEVKAYPDARNTGKSKNALLLSPIGEGDGLLRTPSDLKGYAESSGPQTPLSSTARSRAAKLRRALRDSESTEPCSTSSSPPTGVTQGYAPLYEEDGSLFNTPSPHFTSISSPSRAETGAEEIPLQLEVSDWGSPSPTPSSSDSCPSAEEHTLTFPRCMPLHPEPPSRSMGVKYRSLTDLTDTESIDSRIWLPRSRVFDPEKVKPRPLTRPSSPAKRDASPIPSHETVGSNLPFQISVVHSPFVRADRGRHSRLAPSCSLPIFPDRELEDSCSDVGSHPTRMLGIHYTGKEKKKELDHSVRDVPTERLTGHGRTPRNHGRSHIQLVPRNGRDEQSVIMVHCPPNCSHETCYCRPLASSPPTIKPTRPAGSRYVDACVSPIITITSRIQDSDRGSLAKIRSKGPDSDGDRPYELTGFTHAPHKDIAPENDVRSPLVKGTMVPMNAAETRTRWQNAYRARRLTWFMDSIVLFDLARFTVVLAVTVLTHVFWALQSTAWTPVSSSTGF